MLNQQKKFSFESNRQIKERTLLTALENILYFYDESAVTKLFGLTRDEYLFLYGASIGCDMAELMDYLDRQQSAIYALRRKIIRKFKVSTFEQVMFCFGQMNQDG